MVAELMYFNAQGKELKNMVSTTTFYKSSCERLPITQLAHPDDIEKAKRF